MPERETPVKGFEMPQSLAAAKARPLSGDIKVPGDKSISHRALMLGALCVGETRIRGLLEGHDVQRTAAAMTAMGAKLERLSPGDWRIHGAGLGGLAQPASALDMGNAGTATRLIMGLVAGHPIQAVFTGDASLSRRPMARVIEPLSSMGAQISASPGGRLPLTVFGADPPMPGEHELRVPSAQVKSAILLCGLLAPGRTTVIESVPTRDHTERMLRAFGASVEIAELGANRKAISIQGEPELRPAAIEVPGDPSSAAFFIIAGLIVPGSNLLIRGVGLNVLRTGLFDCLREMGADLAIEHRREIGGEPVGDVRVRAASLRAIEVPVERAASMIDEYPILGIAAAFAKGRTVMRGAAELRVKESDRIRAMARGLEASGVRVEELEDGLVIEGRDRVPGGVKIETELDHRIAMSFLVLGQAAEAPVAIDDAGMIETSFPGFVPLLRHVGGRVEASEQ